MAPKQQADRTHKAIPRRCDDGDTGTMRGERVDLRRLRLPVAAIVRPARISAEAGRERGTAAEDSEDCDQRDHAPMIDHMFVLV
jgi:hypothetical protein